MKIERPPIRLLLDYVDSEGKFIAKEFTIKVEDVVSTEKHPNGRYNHGKHEYWRTYKSAYSIKIPDHIHEALKGQTVWIHRLGNVFGDKHYEYSKDLKKTLRCSSLEALTESWLQIMADYRWTFKARSANLEKVIFYRVESRYGEKSSEWDRSKVGFEAKLLFAFDIGYLSKVDGEVVATYNRDKKQINTRSVREYKEMKSIAWTEEREQFFSQTIYSNFIAIISKLMQFQKDGNEENIDALIASNSLALGN